MFLVKNLHESAGLQTQTCSNISYSNAANYSCAEGHAMSLFIKRLSVCTWYEERFEVNPFKSGPPPI